MSNDLLQHLSTAVLWLDGDLHVRSLNQAAEALFETSQSRALGERFDALADWGHDQSAPNVEHPIQQALANERTITVRQTHLTLPSGTSWDADYTVTPLAESLRGVLLEVSPLQSALQIERDESFASQQAGARMVLRGLAHEIKNPLGGLRGAAQLLERELSDPHLKEYTRVIIEEADRLRDLLDRLLLPTVRPRTTTINVHRVLERVLQLIGAEAPNIQLVRDYDPSLPELQGDEAQLIQAVLNIARNAVQSLSERGSHDGAAPRIEMRTRIVRQATLGMRRHRLAARIEVLDNGRGIAPPVLQRLFFPLVTDRPTGSGLGLSIAQGIVHQHHGNIECSSAPGSTRFILTLPTEQPT